jgi:hypothetical protein
MKDMNRQEQAGSDRILTGTDRDRQEHTGTGRKIQEQTGNFVA